MTDQEIKELIQIYIHKGLPDRLEDALWIEFLKDDRYFNTYLELVDRQNPRAHLHTNRPLSLRFNL